jgi:hypothetical protein
MAKSSRVADQVHHLAGVSLRSAGISIGDAAFGQQHALNAKDVVIGPVPTRPYGSTAQEQAYEKRLRELISISPNCRTMTREQMILIGTAEFRLTQRRAKEIRRYVIRDLGATGWSKGGAPRGARPRR